MADRINSASQVKLLNCLQQSYTNNSGKRIRVSTAFRSAIIAADKEHTRSSPHFEPVQVVEASRREIVVKITSDCPITGIKNASLLAEGGTVIQSRIQLAEAENSITISLESELPLGYYTLALEVKLERDWILIRQLIISSPPRAWVKNIGQTRNVLAVQLYAIRSKRNWGIGDFGDLKKLTIKAEEAGYDLLALNPMHMTHIGQSGESSPYSPTSRLLLNWLYIDIQSLAVYRQLKQQLNANWLYQEGLPETISRLQKSNLVDYDRVAKVKFWVLSELSSFFWAQYDRDESYAPLFRKFLHANERRIRGQFGINESNHSGLEQSLRFHLFTQFCCEQQLADCFPTDGTIQPIIDLAIGVKPDSLEVLANQDCYLSAMSLGAPPDAFNPAGQIWNIAPCDPISLRKQYYRPLIELLRVNMPRDGGVRIDHVMWITRQYWIPNGRSAASGGYVRFGIDEILAILRLESIKRRCLIIGEDLGTVPRGFRNQLTDSGVFLMDVLPFSKSFSQEPIRMSSYLPMIAAFVNTHDMPMFGAIWSEVYAFDLLNAGLVSQAELPSIQKKQAKMKASFAAIIASNDEKIDCSNAIRLLNEKLLARQPAFLFTLLDDLLGETLPINIPGTVDEYPNWRRKHTQNIEEIALTPI